MIEKKILESLILNASWILFMGMESDLKMCLDLFVCVDLRVWICKWVAKFDPL